MKETWRLPLLTLFVKILVVRLIALLQYHESPMQNKTAMKDLWSSYTIGRLTIATKLYGQIHYTGYTIGVYQK